MKNYRIVRVKLTRNVIKWHIIYNGYGTAFGGKGPSWGIGY